MRFFRRSRPPDSPTPAEQLRADIASLEAEEAASTRHLAELEERGRAAEARAVEAIHAGDDGAARAALVELQSLAEKAAAIVADLQVLRGILDECRELVDRMPKDSPAGS